MQEEMPEFIIAELLSDLQQSLAVAESCTGGLIAHRITNVPGSSTYFLGGVVAYANRVKMQQLGVAEQTLVDHGAVSKETVLEMARGVRQALGADIGLSVSGIAGPGGGSSEKPVGLTWIGLSASDFEGAWCFTWAGARIQVKEQAAEQALRILVDYLKNKRIYKGVG